MIPRRPSFSIRTAAAGFLLFLLAVRLVPGRDLLEVTPQLSLTGNYNDNIEFTALDPVGDYYAEISPGVWLRLNLPLLPLEIRYTYTRYEYREESRFNRDFHFFDFHTVHGLQLTRNLALNIRNKYEAIPVDVTVPEDDSFNLTQRNQFTLTPVWENRVSRKLKLSAGYEFARVDYLASAFQEDDYFGHRFFNVLNYEIDRSLHIYQRNAYLMRFFSGSPDYYSFVPEAGLQIGLGRRASVAVAGGYSFEKSAGERYGGYVYSIAGEWEITHKLDLSASFNQRRTIDIAGLLYTRRYHELKLDYRPAKRLVLETYGRYYDHTIRGSDFRRLEFKAGFNYELNRWTGLNGGYLRYQSLDSPDQGRAVANRVYAGIGLSF